MPTLKRWLDEGTHRLLGWEPDLSSQTSASQAGILLGDNTGIPAFRWYDKPAGKLMVTSKLETTSEVEHRLSTGQGLLADGGASRWNIFSGDATDCLCTYSAVHDKQRITSRGYVAYFTNPYTFSRTLALFVGDVVRERWQARRPGAPRRTAPDSPPFQVRLHPRRHDDGDAGGQPLHADLGHVPGRAGGLQHASSPTTRLPTIPASTGPTPSRCCGRWTGCSPPWSGRRRMAPRPYHFVVLSDHGQSMGATFKQRYGKTLSDLVDELISPDQEVKGFESTAEDTGNVNLALTEATRQGGKVAGLVKRATRRQHER